MPERSFSVRLGARVDEYVAAMNRAKAATSGWSKETEANVAKVGGQMQKVGGWATTRVTLPLVALGTAAGKAGFDFDQAFTRMVALAGVGADEVDGLKKAVLDLSGQTARSPQELANALYEAASAGLDSKQALDAVTVAAKGAAAGLGSTEDVVGLVASAISSYGADVISAAEATDVLTATIRAGRADPDELAGTLGRILPFASQLGITFGEVGGTVAYLSNIFGDTNRTVTAMSGLFAKLLSPTAQGRKALADMGTSVEELQAAIDQRGLLGALDLLREHGFAGNQQALQQLFDDIEGRQAALTLLNDNSGQLAATLDEVTDSAGAAGDAFATWESSDSADLAMNLNELRVAAVQAGEVILPFAADVAGGIGSVARAFSTLPGPAQTSVLVLLGTAAAMGPVVRIGGTVVKNFQTIAAVTGTMSRRLRTAEGDLNAVGKATAGVGLALGTLAGSQIAMDVLNQISDNGGNLERKLQGLTIAIGALEDGSGDGATALEKFRDSVAAEGKGMKFSNLWEDFGKEVKIVGGSIGRNIEEIDRAFGKLLDQDPRQAQALLDVWRQQADALDHNSGQYRDNMMLIDRYQERVDLAVGSQEVLARSTEDVAAAQSAHVEATLAQYKSLFGLVPVTDRATQSEEDRKAALDEATAAIQDNVDALHRQIEAEQARIDQARAAADSTFALRLAQADWNDALAELPKKVRDAKGDADDLDRIYIDMAKHAVEVADATRDDAFNDGWITTQTQGLDLWNRKMLELAASVDGPARGAIVGYIAETNQVPTGIVTDIVAAVDPYGLDTAAGALADLSATRDSTVQVDANTTAADQQLAALESGNYEATLKVRVAATVTGALNSLTSQMQLKFPQSAAGSYLNSSSVIEAGEDGAEWIAPLTKPELMRRWLQDRRIRGPVLSALGLPAFASGGVAGMFPPSSGIITSNYAQYLQAPTQVSSTSTSSRMANMHEVGDLSDDAYRSYLVDELAGLEKYSDEWTRVNRLIKQLDADRVKAAQDAAAAELAAEDQKYAAMYEMGEISRAAYEAYLQARMNSFEVYSTDYMQRWRTLADLQRQSEREEQERLEAQAKEAADRLAGIFDAATARYGLVKAERDLEESWQDVSAAKQALAGAKKDDERQRAQEQVASALNRTADDAFAGAKARARANGLVEGTAEWARWIRAEVTTYAEQHPELAFRLAEWLQGVPQFASGAYFEATSGGQLAMLGKVAEAGEGEWVLPDSKMMAYARTAAQLAITSSSTTASPAPEMQVAVKVFVGDREITDIVRVEVDRSQRQTAQSIRAGWRN